MYKLVTIILTLFVALASCSESKTKRPAAKVHLAEPITTEISKDTSLTDPDIHKTFPAYVQAAMAVLPDNYLIDVDHVIYGDFNADDKEDFSSKVTNLENGEQGVLIVHNSDKKDYLIFGAGREINGMTDLDWIDIFNTIPKGEIIAPTLVDSVTGDIIGPDKSQEFKLLGNGIYMHVDEASGGGILYWTGKKYNWFHLE